MILKYTVAFPHDFCVEHVTQWRWISICMEGRGNKSCLYLLIAIANRKSSVFHKKTNLQV